MIYKKRGQSYLWQQPRHFLSLYRKQGKVGYSRHIFAFSATATLFQVQTSSEFVTHEATLYTQYHAKI